MARLGLKEKAERLGAGVALLESPRMVEVAALAGRRRPMALACSAWLMDGTQALRWPVLPLGTACRSW